MSVLLSNSVRVYPIKLKVVMLYHTNNTSPNTGFLDTVDVSLINKVCKSYHIDFRIFLVSVHDGIMRLLIEQFCSLCHIFGKTGAFLKSTTQ